MVHQPHCNDPYALEISSKSQATNVTVPESSEKQITSSNARELEEPAVSPRPQREATVQGRRLVRQWCTLENVIDHSYVGDQLGGGCCELDHADLNFKLL